VLPDRVYDYNEQNFAIRCIMRIFRAFAKEACALRKERGWTIERIQSESKEFLRRLTIMIVFDKFPGLDRHWISNWNGSINSDVERRFWDSAEWKAYEDLLLATPASAPEEIKSTNSLLHEKQIPATQPPDQNLRDAILKAPSVPITDRSGAIDAYIEEVFSKTRKRITRTDIWKSAGYKTRTEFERWQRRDLNKVNKAADERFSKMLADKPHLKCEKRQLK
jgi:hypothetical protein